jgi:hypothetical protein
MKTRFKLWQRLVGSAVEHASSLMGEKVDFAELFQATGEDDEDETSLAAVLDIMSGLWKDRTFTAQDLCDAINDKKTGSGVAGDEFRSIYVLEDADRQQLRGFFCPKLASDKSASSQSVGMHLKNHTDEPVRNGDWTLVLRSQKKPDGGGKGGKLYKVARAKPEGLPSSETSSNKETSQTPEAYPRTAADANRPVCAQCHDEPDGKERLVAFGGETVWLHPECERFFCSSWQPPEAPSGNVASVPFMITRAQKNELRNLGLGDDDIATLTPAEAHEILSKGEKE